LLTYMDAVNRGDPPIAKWLHLGPAAGMAYDTFWQAYAGTIATGALAADFGGWARLLRPALATLTAAGLVTRDDGLYHLTARGFDRYHDLERWVTYHFIEPLLSRGSRAATWLRLGWRSLLIVLDSIWRIRSRVTP
jgi:hypothetical protein